MHLKTKKADMTNQDRKEFNMYLKSLTDSQVLGVLEKERKANRKEYALLAEIEARLRRLTWL